MSPSHASMFQSAVIHAEHVFTGHNAVVNGVCYNRHQDCFVSSDDTCLRLWSAQKGELRRVELPARTNSFIQAIAYVESRQLYVAAALDGTLKLYDANLSELASVFTGRGAIRSLIFDAKHNRLLSGGVDGCAAWLVRGKPLGASEGGVNPNYELSLLSTFFSAPAAAPFPADSNGPDPSTTPATTVGPKLVRGSKTFRKQGAMELPHERAWVCNLQLNADKTRLYAQSKQCVDVFSAVDGRFLETYRDLFPKEYGAILAFVVHDKTQYIVCGCLNGWIFVVSLHPVSVVHVFKDHTLRVTGLVVHSSSNLILSSSLDGTVRLWDLEARRQAHRLNIGQPVHDIQLLVPHANPCRFYCRVRSAVQLFRIQSTIKEHLPALSPVCVLQRVLFPAHEHGNSANDRSRAAPTGDDSAESDGDGEDSDDDNENDDRVDGSESDAQVIVAAGMDKTIRLFSGRAANEAPTFTWIPEESALDMVGFALHPVGKHLFLLLESQKIIVVDVSVRDKEESAVVRTVDLSVSASAFGASGGNGRQSSSTSKANASSTRRAVGSTPATTISSNSTRSSSPPGGLVKCICVCHYPPIFRSTTISATATTHVPPAAQSKWFSRTFVNRRQPSSVAQGLKKLEEEHATTATSDTAGEATGRRRNALVQSEYEWIVCGSEFGHLLFWHTGLANSGKEAISIDAHDAGILDIATSTTSPLLVSLDEANRVNLWYFQPVFMLCRVLDLGGRPSCFALSPTSELLLSGYDDGRVVFMDVRDAAVVHTFANDDDDHSAMVSAADFLDEKALVLTASVDATIKIWDQEKNLLHQLSLAMAFTSLCFMNASGDVMAGLSNGIFIVTREDVLPEKAQLTHKSLSSRRHRELANQNNEDAASRWRSQHLVSNDGRQPTAGSDTVVASGQLPQSHCSERISHDRTPQATASVLGSSVGTGWKPPILPGTSSFTTHLVLSPVQHPQLPLAGESSDSSAASSSLSSWKRDKAQDVATQLSQSVNRPLQEQAPVLRQLPRSPNPTLLPETLDVRAASLPARAPSRRYVRISHRGEVGGGRCHLLTDAAPSIAQRKRETYSQTLPLIACNGKEDDWREQLLYVIAGIDVVCFQGDFRSGD